MTEARGPSQHRPSTLALTAPRYPCYPQYIIHTILYILSILSSIYYPYFTQYIIHTILNISSILPTKELSLSKVIHKKISIESTLQSMLWAELSPNLSVHSWTHIWSDLLGKRLSLFFCCKNHQNESFSALNMHSHHTNNPQYIIHTILNTYSNLSSICYLYQCMLVRLAWGQYSDCFSQALKIFSIYHTYYPQYIIPTILSSIYTEIYLQYIIRTNVSW